MLYSIETAGDKAPFTFHTIHEKCVCVCACVLVCVYKLDALTARVMANRAAAVAQQILGVDSRQ